MEENNTSPGAGATPTAPGTGATPTASQGATPTPKQPATLEEALRELEEVRRHASNKEEQATRHGKSLAALEKEVAAYRKRDQDEQLAQMSDNEKLTKRLQEIEQKAQTYQKQLIASQVREAAHQLGIIDPDMAALAIERVLEYDESGMPTNTDKALADLVKNKPYLVKADADASPTTPAQSPTPRTPVLPAMNPPVTGRSTIQSPAGSLPPGGRQRIPTWDEVYKTGKKQ
jgi:hypothetical protein